MPGHMKGGNKFSIKRGARALSKAGKTLTTRKQRKAVGNAAAGRIASMISGSGHTCVVVPGKRRGK